MPRLEAARKERRKAEHDVQVMQNRIRLLRETADNQEKRAQLEKDALKKREIVQGDAEWLKDTVESEMMRREIGGAEKKAQAAEQRDVTHAQLSQSKTLVAFARKESARRVREDVQYKLDAAYDQKRCDFERRRQLADAGRRHKQWYRDASATAAKEYNSRVSEMRHMSIAEEETRSWVAVERNELYKDAVAIEEQRLRDLKARLSAAPPALAAGGSGAGGAVGDGAWAGSGVAEDGLRQNGVQADGRPGGFDLAGLSLGAAGWGGGGLGLGLPGRSLSAGPALRKQLTQYQITGPGMATVIKAAAQLPTHAGAPPTLHRVHFPFSIPDQSQFAFAPGSGVVRQAGPQHGVRRKVLRGGAH
jgi:hypothetical protein